MIGRMTCAAVRAGNESAGVGGGSGTGRTVRRVVRCGSVRGVLVRRLGVWSVGNTRRAAGAGRAGRRRASTASQRLQASSERSGGVRCPVGAVSAQPVPAVEVERPGAAAAASCRVVVHRRDVSGRRLGRWSSDSNSAKRAPDAAPRTKPRCWPYCKPRRRVRAPRMVRDRPAQHQVAGAPQRRWLWP